jgi:uncharacterized protein (TIGR03905 family)
LISAFRCKHTKRCVIIVYKYKTKGTCSSLIEVELEGNIIKKVRFEGGCSGNLIGISKMVEGMTVEEVIEKFKGIPCGIKKTSCPDQLALAVSEAYKSES